MLISLKLSEIWKEQCEKDKYFAKTLEPALSRGEGWHLF